MRAPAILKALLSGFPIVSERSTYRYVNKNDHLYDSDDRSFFATNTGIYMKMHSIKHMSDGAKHEYDKWVGIECTLGGFVSICDNMTEEEFIDVIGSVALTGINAKEREVG